MVTIPVGDELIISSSPCDGAFVSFLDVDKFVSSYSIIISESEPAEELSIEWPDTDIFTEDASCLTSLDLSVTDPGKGWI